MPGVYSKKILIVENDQRVSDRIVPEFVAYGYECFLAHDGDTTLAELSQRRPDLVIIDVSMSDVDGFAIFEAIRALPDTTLSGVPVIIGSFEGDLVEISRAIKLNIKDYFITSTLDTKLVAEKVHKVLGGNVPVPQEVPPSTPSVPTNEPTLLIVEDDKFLRDLSTQKFKMEHLQVFAAVDGEQGISLAQEHTPDVILLDILLPGIDGFEVLKRLRESAQFAKTHVVMLSNFGQKEDIERAFAAGADKFLVKANYTLDEIVQEVKKIIATPRELAKP